MEQGLLFKSILGLMFIFLNILLTAKESFHLSWPVSNSQSCTTEARNVEKHYKGNLLPSKNKKNDSDGSDDDDSCDSGDDSDCENLPQSKDKSSKTSSNLPDKSRKALKPKTRTINVRQEQS